MEQHWFDMFVLLIIIFNSAIMIAMPMREENAVNVFADAANNYITAVFTMECLMKVPKLSSCKSKQQNLPNHPAFSKRFV